MSPQPNYSDGGWATSSKFVWGPDDVLLNGHITVISIARDLEKHLGEPLTVENVRRFRERQPEEGIEVNWPLVEAGLRRRGLL